MCLSGMGAVRKLIYIVDDSADYRFLVGQVFKRFLTQYTVHFFESGTALFEHAKTEPADLPGLVLIDGQMPGLSGIETLLLLRQQRHWQNIPVAIVSSNNSISDQQEAYDSGASSYLVKPIDFISLRDQLGRLCQQWTGLG